jgi:hypothetical protein
MRGEVEGKSGKGTEGGKNAGDAKNKTGDGKDDPNGKGSGGKQDGKKDGEGGGKENSKKGGESGTQKGGQEGKATGKQDGDPKNGQPKDANQQQGDRQDGSSSRQAEQHRAVAAGDAEVDRRHARSDSEMGGVRPPRGGGGVRDRAGVPAIPGEFHELGEVGVGRAVGLVEGAVRLVGEAQEGEAAVLSASGGKPLRPFSSYTNPFADGSAGGMSPEEVVRYTFAAFEAWAYERDLGRRPDETPLEFARRVGDEVPALEEEAGRLVHLFARAAYARGPLPGDALAEVEAFWEKLEAVVARPLSA